MSKVTGFRETARSLRSLARQVAKPVGEASRNALNPVLGASKENLLANNSVHRGVLQKSMAIRKMKSSAASIIWAVTATGRGVGIAHLVEFGTEPHWQPKRKWMHPGARPKPFLTPAYHVHGDEAVETFGREIGPAMERQAAVLASKVR